MKDCIKYNTDNSYVEISIYLPSESRELHDPLFQFNAIYYVEKVTPLADEEEFNYEKIPTMVISGHTGNFEEDYIYTADAIAESTIENYAFAKGMFEQLYDTDFHEKIILQTGLSINRWLTFESVRLTKDSEELDENSQAELFYHFLTIFKQTWRELFVNDVTLVSFNERLYVSPEDAAQKKVNQAYEDMGFHVTLNKQNSIEGNIYDESNITLKELFDLDSSDNLFSTNMKNPNSIHYYGLIYL